MFAEAFVYFLLINGVLTQKQAAVALSKRIAKVRPAIVAVFEKLITEEQARRIMQLQITEDMPFGFLAVREGFLTNDQLSLLLGRQSKEDLEIMQVLSDKGFLTMEEVMQYFLEFQEFYKLSDEDYAAMVAGKPEVYVKTIGRIDDVLGLFGQYVSLFIGTYAKCVDYSVRIEEAYSPEKIQGRYIASVGCEGDKDLTLGLLCDDNDTLLEFSSRFMKKRVKNYSSDTEDSIKEFMNMVGGIFIAVAEKNMGLDIEIQVPEMKTNGFLTTDREIAAIDLFSGQRKLTLFLC